MGCGRCRGEEIIANTTAKVYCFIKKEAAAVGILSKEKIMDLVEKGSLNIEPFDPSKAEPASYDMSLGSVLRAGHGRVNITESSDFVLESNTWACIASREVLRLPNNVSARYGIPSSLARRGLIAFGGPQIDPGYRGKIFVSAYNPTLEPINLRFGQDFFTIIFEQVEGECEGYAGTYQDQTDFPVADVEMMMRMRSKNLSDVIDRVETLDGSVTNLAANMKTLNDSVATITTDLHELKVVIKDYLPWVKIIFGIVGIAGAAIVGDTAINWFNGPDQ
ncbi:MAG: deaminase [Pseudomonadota bacterium]|jgi:dCTP deaminase